MSDTQETNLSHSILGSAREIAQILAAEKVFVGVCHQSQLVELIPTVVAVLARHGIDATPGHLILEDNIVFHGWNFTWRTA